MSLETSRNNDLELCEHAREAKKLAQSIDATLANMTPNAVVTLAAHLENAARKMGWRAWEIEKARRDECLKSSKN